MDKDDIAAIIAIIFVLLGIVITVGYIIFWWSSCAFVPLSEAPVLCISGR